MSHLLPISLTLQYKVYLLYFVQHQRSKQNNIDTSFRKQIPGEWEGVASTNVCKWLTPEPHFADQLISLWSREGLNKLSFLGKATA